MGPGPLSSGAKENSLRQLLQVELYALIARDAHFSQREVLAVLYGVNRSYHQLPRKLIRNS